MEFGVTSKVRPTNAHSRLSTKKPQRISPKSWQEKEFSDRHVFSLAVHNETDVGGHVTVMMCLDTSCDTQVRRRAPKTSERCNPSNEILFIILHAANRQPNATQNQSNNISTMNNPTETASASEPKLCKMGCGFFVSIALICRVLREIR